MDSFIFFGKRGFGANNTFIENVCSTLCSNSISKGFVPFLQTKLFKMKLIRIMQVLLLSCFALLCKIAKIFFKYSKMYKGGKQHIQSKKRKICNNSQCSNTLLVQLTSISPLFLAYRYRSNIVKEKSPGIKSTKAGEDSQKGLRLNIPLYIISQLDERVGSRNNIDINNKAKVNFLFSISSNGKCFGQFSWEEVVY